MQKGNIINWVAFGAGVFLLNERGMSGEAIAGISLIALGIGSVRRLIDRFIP